MLAPLSSEKSPRPETKKKYMPSNQFEYFRKIRKRSKKEKEKKKKKKKNKANRIQALLKGNEKSSQQFRNLYHHSKNAQLNIHRMKHYFRFRLIQTAIFREKTLRYVLINVDMYLDYKFGIVIICTYWARGNIFTRGKSLES